MVELTIDGKSYSVAFSEAYDMEEHLSEKRVEFETDPQGESIWGSIPSHPDRSSSCW